MWHSITSAFAKDLGEFASVVTSDTQKILRSTPTPTHTPREGATPLQGGTDEMTESTAATTVEQCLGDENTPDGIRFANVPFNTLFQQIQELQSTYLSPFSSDEKAAFDKWDSHAYTNLVPNLLENSEVVNQLYMQLVKETKSVSAEDFFSRYFFRLTQLRKEIGLQLENEERKRIRQKNLAELIEGNEKEVGGFAGKKAKAEQSGWDGDVFDVDDEEKMNSSEGDVQRQLLLQVKQEKLELEKLVQALSHQLEVVCNENHKLKAELERYKNSTPPPTTPKPVADIFDEGVSPPSKWSSVERGSGKKAVLDSAQPESPVVSASPNNNNTSTSPLGVRGASIQTTTPQVDKENKNSATKEGASCHQPVTSPPSKPKSNVDEDYDQWS